MKDRSLIDHGVRGPESPSAETVLLLNGGMMSHSAWEPIAEPLSRSGDGPGRRVVSCDFRGQMLSPAEPPATLDGHVEDVIRLLDALELPPVHLLGTSFGAAVGLLLASHQPERVRSLALVTATDRITPAMRQDIAALRQMAAAVAAGADRERFHEHVVSTVYSDGYRRRHADELAERGRRMDLLPVEWFERLDGLLAAFAAADLEPAMEGAARHPVLVALATDDRVIPPERSRALAEALGAEVVEHPTSGHALVVEDPEWLTTVYRAFVRRLGPGGVEGAP